MPEMDDSSAGPPPSGGGGGDIFSSTHWSWVEQARAGAVDALERLTVTYRRPLLKYAGRKVLPPADPEDAVQGFFAAFLRREGFLKADKERGKMRAWLLGCFNNWLKELNRRGQREPQLVGGEEVPEGVTREDPERLYESEFARALINRGLMRLRAEVLARGPEGAREWELMAPLLEEGRSPRGEGKEVAALLGLAEGTVRGRLSRMRCRLRDILREEVAATLVEATPEAVEEELRYLMGLFQAEGR